MLIIKWEVMPHFTAKLITTLNKITNIWETAFRAYVEMSLWEQSEREKQLHTLHKAEVRPRAHLSTFARTLLMLNVLMLNFIHLQIFNNGVLVWAQDWPCAND